MIAGKISRVCICPPEWGYEKIEDESGIIRCVRCTHPAFKMWPDSWVRKLVMHALWFGILVAIALETIVVLLIWRPWM